MSHTVPIDAVAFWNDPDHTRYDAAYFDRFEACGTTGISSRQATLAGT